MDAATVSRKCVSAPKKTHMKALILAGLIAMTVFPSCHKMVSNTSTSYNGDWRLVNRYSTIGSIGRVQAPGRDSSVFLALNSNNTYTTRLNYKIVSQGAYSVTIDSAFYNRQLLEFSNFKPTGIFALFTVGQVGVNGQLLSVFDGMFMNISHDSLTLSGALTPGGTVSYLFVKQ